jgi:hypothetical protein
MGNRFAQGALQVCGPVTVVDGPGAIGEEPAGHGGAAGRHREWTRQRTAQLVDLGFADDNRFPVERRVWIAETGWPTSQHQQVPPAFGQGTTRVECDQQLSPGGQEQTRLGRTTLGELAIERGGEQPPDDADPSAVATNGQLMAVVLVNQEQRRRRCS